MVRDSDVWRELEAHACHLLSAMELLEACRGNVQGSALTYDGRLWLERQVNDAAEQLGNAHEHFVAVLEALEERFQRTKARSWIEAITVIRRHAETAEVAETRPGGKPEESSDE